MVFNVCVSFLSLPVLPPLLSTLLGLDLPSTPSLSRCLRKPPQWCQGQAAEAHLVAQTNLLRNQVTLANLARAGAFWSVVLPLVLGGAGCPSAQPHGGVGRGSDSFPSWEAGLFSNVCAGETSCFELRGRRGGCGWGQGLWLTRDGPSLS